MGLWARGYESLFAADALSATAALVKERLDLVILDLGLPCGDGFVMMERLRNNDYLAGISVSGLTGGEFENPRNRTCKRGHRLLSTARSRQEAVVSHSLSQGFVGHNHEEVTVC